MKRLPDDELTRRTSQESVSAEDKIIVQRRPNDLARLLNSIRRGEAGSEAARKFFDRKTPPADS